MTNKDVFDISIENAKKFNKYKYDGTILYTCTVCGNKKNIFHMLSNSGSRMICTLCAKRNYGSEIKALNEYCLMRNRKGVK